MHLHKVFVFIISFFLVSVTTVAQKNFRKDGDKAFNKGKYKTALNNYNLVKDIKKDKILLARRGLTHFKLNQLSKAIVDFTNAKTLGNDSPALYLLMAQTKQHLNEYEEASFFYKEYVKAVGEKDPSAFEAIREMKNCAYSAFHQKDATTGYLESFGDDVNTYYDEIYVLHSPQFGNKYYFTSNRNVSDFNLFSYEIDKKGKWELEKKFGKTLNTKVNEYVMDISNDGKTMIFIRMSKTETNNKIFASTFDEDDNEHIIELPDYLIDGAIDLQIVDYNTLAFASDQLGGEGGYDIFTINYKNGVWSDPINEGPGINSQYDERSPYFDSTADYLYFSSNRPYCLGGFDIYYYNKLAIDAKPKNLGSPINSSGNDLQFRLNINGQTALMSSDRKTGEGSYDIYFAYLNDIKPMSPKDDRQLEYIKDYFKYIKAKAAKELANNTKVKEPKTPKKVENQSKAKEAKETEITSNTTKPTTTAPIVSTSDKEEKTKEPNKPKSNSSRKINRVTRTKAKKLVEPDSTELASADKQILETKTTKQKKAEIPKKEIAEAEVKPKKAKNNKSRTKKVAPKKNKEKADTDKLATTNTKKRSKKKRKTKVEKQAIAQKDLLPLKLISGAKINNTILYQDRHDLMNKVNKNKIDKIVEQLLKRKDLNINLIAHTDHLEPGLPEFMQYNTLKRATLIARYMMENGIQKDRISIESVCANYPVTKPELAGLLNTEYLAYNKRVDFEFRTQDNVTVSQVDLKKFELPSHAQDRRHELYTFIREEVYYSVEIASADHIYKNAVLRLYDDIYIRKANPTANNKYYIGLYTKYEDALELRNELNESSVDNAKVVAFYDGFPIKQDAIKKLTTEYPDLSKYVTSLQE